MAAVLRGEIGKGEGRVKKGETDIHMRDHPCAVIQYGENTQCQM